jgi:hypothetical protein
MWVIVSNDFGICRVGSFEARLRIDEAVAELRRDRHHAIEGALDEWNELTSVHTPPFDALDQQYRTSDSNEVKRVSLGTAVAETPVGTGWVGRLQPRPRSSRNAARNDLRVGCVDSLRAWPIRNPLPAGPV